MKGQSERSILPHILNLGVTRGLVANATPRLLYPREGDPASIVQEAGWAPEPVWTGAKNFAATGLRSADRPENWDICFIS
jgi:hypothetical protein